MDGAVAAYFSDLAESVSHRWAQLGRGPGQLTEAAVAGLKELPPGPNVGALPVLEYAISSSMLPTHQSSLSDPFGQPPLVLWSGPDFFIQALTWIDGTTDIHQHGFDGAFAVAEGASLHVPYRFSLGESTAEGHIVAGDLIMGQPEILRPGDVRPIDAGFRFIHALFHLERPTVTIVVRNESSGLPHPQYSYLRPGLGYDRPWSDRVVGKRLQALGAVRRLDPTAAETSATELVATASPWVGFLALRDVIGWSGWTDRAAGLCDTLSKRVGAAGELLAPALQAETQQGNILARRDLMNARHQRTFLALLANLPDRAAVHSVVGALYPGQAPERLVFEWVLELASAQYRGISGLRLSDDQRAALGGRLENLGTDDRATGADLRQALGDLATGWEPPVLLRSLLAI